MSVRASGVDAWGVKTPLTLNRHQTLDARRPYAGNFRITPSCPMPAHIIEHFVQPVDPTHGHLLRRSKPSVAAPLEGQSESPTALHASLPKIELDGELFS